MAYTSTVTKSAVEQLTEVDFKLTIDVVINDGAEDVFTDTFFTRYNNTTSISDVRTALQDKIKVKWDAYVAEKAILDAAAFDTMCTNIEGALDTYTNA